MLHPAAMSRARVSYIPSLINDFAPSTMGWVRHLIYAQREASTGAFKAKLAAKLPF